MDQTNLGGISYGFQPHPSTHQAQPCSLPEIRCIPTGSKPTSSPRAQGRTMWVVVWESGKWGSRHVHLTNTEIVLTKVPLPLAPCCFLKTLKEKSSCWWRHVQGRLLSQAAGSPTLSYSVKEQRKRRGLQESLS